jgi:hypothetical protein
MFAAVLPEIHLRKNIPATNDRELNSTTDKVHAE